MGVHKTYKSRGLVLKQTAIGEADRVVTIFSPDFGKLRAVARGIRRPKSKLAGHLEPLTYVSVSISKGRTLDVISDAQTLNNFRQIRESLPLVSGALYLSELTESFSTEQESNDNLFMLLLQCLQTLPLVDDLSILIRWFEMRVLDLSGFKPEFYECVECRLTLERSDYSFSSSSGGVLCNSCKIYSSDSLLPLTIATNKVLRHYQNQPLRNVISLSVPPKVGAEMTRLLRSYTKYVLERKLKSIEFMDLVVE